MARVAFTGYRPEKLPFRESESDAAYLRFRKTLYKVIRRMAELGYTEFVSGVAMGFDTWVAEDVLRLRAERRDVRLECAIPFPTQADRWCERDKFRRERILAAADSVTTLSPEYTQNAFFIRNRYMVDGADAIVCCYDGKTGGTAYTIDYAKKQGKVIIQINPTDMVVTIVAGDKKIADDKKDIENA